MLPGRQHPLQEEDFKVGEHVWRLPTHHLHQLRRQLEGWRLKAKVTGGGGEHKAKVDVYDVAFVVKENVTVVSVEGNHQHFTLTLTHSSLSLTLSHSSFSFTLHFYYNPNTNFILN